MDVELISARRKVIAVVEDEPSMLKGVGRLLTASGYDTEGFASAEAFLAGAIASEASCLLVDIHLSGISGIELRRRLAATGSTLPVIFMTAVDDETSYREALEVGCVAFLRKPFRAHLLIDAIRKVLVEHGTRDRAG
jgi:FixJ family two-component response regulator